MLTGYTRFRLVLIPCASGILPLYTLRDCGEGMAIGARAELEGSGATPVSAGGCSAVCGWPRWEAEAPTALVARSWAFQPFFSWQVTRKMFWPCRG
jgi:hypothetical protein